MIHLHLYLKELPESNMNALLKELKPFLLEFGYKLDSYGTTFVKESTYVMEASSGWVGENHD